MDRKHNVAYIKSSPVGRENSRRNQGEKPSLGSSRWDSNLWPLPPQSSALSYSVRAFKNQPVIESNSFRVRVIATKELASKVLGS